MFEALKSIRRIAVALACPLAAALPLASTAQDVFLNPGHISGTVDVIGQPIDRVSISASWTDPNTGTTYSASTHLTAAGSYTLTVNVPQGSSPTYTVSASIFMHGFMSFLNPPSQSVSVAASQTSVVDFVINPGLITATVNATSGTVTGLSLNYSGGGGSGFGHLNGNPVILPVYPCPSTDCMQLFGTAIFADDRAASLESQSVSVGAGETATVTWTVTPPTVEKGAIAGRATINGATPTDHSILALGPSVGSADVRGNGPYQMANLNAGSYWMQVFSYFNNSYGNSYLVHGDASFSPTRTPTVTSGSTTNVDITANAAFLEGRLKLTGTRPLSNVTSHEINARQIAQMPAQGSFAATSPRFHDGIYHLVVNEGSWALDGIVAQLLDFSFQTPLNQRLIFTDHQSVPVALAAGETVTRDVTYAMGTVFVNFSMASGGTFSQPYLEGNCSEHDAGGQLKTSYYFFSQTPHTEASTGTANFVGMAGTCRVDAYANVGGSITKFGTLTVTVVPGTSQEVDIGGPALTLSHPPAGYFTSNASITVTGTAADDVAVASVTVNGQAATLTPAAPADSVSFSATVALNFGANQIQTIATDTAAKSASDTRTVYRDETAPTLSWTPAEGASSQLAGITVAGTANDDAGIQSIKVNNVAVAFQPTGNGNEVSFSVPFTLVDGPNFIEVVATDVSGRLTAQTHRVTLGVADTTAPVITPNIVGTLGANGWYRSDVRVTWSVVDPESSVTSTSECGSSTITADTTAAGVTLTCTATSAGGTASNSVTIRRDTSAPQIAGLPAPGSCNLWPPNHRMVRVATVTAQDLLSGVAGALSLSVTSNEGASAQGSGNTSPDWVIGADGSIQLRAERSGGGAGRVYTISASATDAAGNATTRTATCVVPHDQRGK